MMRLNVLLLVAVALVVSAAAAVGGERPIADLKEIAGTWQGWTMLGTTEARVTMVIREDGSYEASTQTGTLTVGRYYLEGGKLRYRSSRSEGAAMVSENRGKTFLTIIPDGPSYETGKTEYERVK
jgi:hypothetical protein